MDYSPHNSLPTPRELEIDDDSQANSLQGEFLRWHYRLGHMSYPKMKLLAILRLNSKEPVKSQTTTMLTL